MNDLNEGFAVSAVFQLLNSSCWYWICPVFFWQPHEPALLEIQKKQCYQSFTCFLRGFFYPWHLNLRDIIPLKGEIHVTLFREFIGLLMTTVSINVGDLFPGLQYTLLIIYGVRTLSFYFLPVFFKIVFLMNCHQSFTTFIWTMKCFIRDLMDKKAAAIAEKTYN